MIDQSINITLNDWQAAGLTYDQYRRQLRNGNIVATRATRNNPVEIQFSSIPPKYKKMLVAQLGDIAEHKTRSTFVERIENDDKAITFYTNYLLEDGRNLPSKNVKQYIADAMVLNTIVGFFGRMSKARKSLTGSSKNFWAKMLLGANASRVEFGHNLPKNESALKRKTLKYIKEGYESLISGKFLNNNSRKVDVSVEQLLLSLYIMPNKPFGCEVHDAYTLFMTGKLSVVDANTGEEYQANDYIAQGAPIEISASTVWNYLNDPKNRAIVDAKRNGQHSYNNMHRPHHHRIAPFYSFSKITMDDRDLPRKINNGKRVKAYYSYDVASGAVVGAAYSRDKDEALFIDCMRDMFRTIDKNNLPMPMEVEVENHLVNKFFDDLHAMFSFVRICRPGNSQEKSAEHFNRAKKYGVEKKNHKGIGRWWSKHEAYRIDSDKIDDEFITKTYDYDQLVADDMADCEQYNNQLHPDQKRYKGMTRWDVLVGNLNPNAPEVSKAAVYRAIGEKTTTSIARNQYCTVQYGKYQLPSTEVLSRLAPNNYEVDAYYLPDSSGVVNEVYIYQNGTFIAKCAAVEMYNRAKAEWTEKDEVAYTEQSKYVSQFDAMVKEGKKQLAKIVYIPQEDPLKNRQHVEIVETIETQEQDLDDLIGDFSNYGERGRQNL